MTTADRLFRNGIFALSLYGEKNSRDFRGVKVSKTTNRLQQQPRLFFCLLKNTARSHTGNQ